MKITREDLNVFRNVCNHIRYLSEELKETYDCHNTSVGNISLEFDNSIDTVVEVSMNDDDLFDSDYIYFFLSEMVNDVDYFKDAHEKKKEENRIAALERKEAEERTEYENVKSRYEELRTKYGDSDEV